MLNSGIWERVSGFIRISLIVLVAVGSLQSKEKKVLRDTHEMLDGILWMQTAPEFSMVTSGAYGLARIRLDAALQDANWSAALEQGGEYTDRPPAVILDIDETVLDNSPYQAQLILERILYSPATWLAWSDMASARPIPGAVEFIHYAQNRGVRVYLVSNRLAGQEKQTLANLEKVGVVLPEPTDSVLLLGERPEWSADKTSRRKWVTEGHRILLLCGDDLNDFVSTSGLSPRERNELAERYRSHWGSKWVVLPNPVYGTWERPLYPAGAADDVVLAAKRKALKGFR